MAHPLDGCFARIARALVHQQTFEADLEAAAEQPDFGPAFEVQMHKKRLAVAVVCKEDFFLPARLGVIFGDVIHNLHAALDNLVFELGRLDGGNPGHDSKFPILNHGNEWFTDDTLSALQFVRPQDRARIELYQPFLFTEHGSPEHHVLAQIKRYSNEGKHRVLTPIPGVVGTGILESLDAHDVNITSSEPFIRKPLRKDAVVAEFGFEITGPEPRVRVNGKIGWYAGLSDRIEASAPGWLKDAIARVEDILADFRDNAF